MQTIPIGDLRLARGGILRDVRVAYESLGALAPARDNVVLVLHGYTSGPDTILPVGDPLEGAWRDLVGPGGFIDTDRFHVVCPNALGSCYGTTGAAATNPETGRAYGSAWPDVTMADVVASQKALLDTLGIEQLVAVVGPSFGGVQAFQWAVDHPNMMRGIVSVLSSLGTPPVMTDRVLAGLSRDVGWNGGDYYGANDLLSTKTAMRVAMLKSFGVEQAMAARVPDAAGRERLLVERARGWAAGFDANALVDLQKIMGTYDVSRRVHEMRAKVLYALSRTDPIFPPHLAPAAMNAFAAAGVAAAYVEIDSDNGHSAASADAAAWGPAMKRFLEAL